MKNTEYTGPEKSKEEILKDHVFDIYVFPRGTLEKREQFEKSVLAAMEAYASQFRASDNKLSDMLEIGRLKQFETSWVAVIDLLYEYGLGHYKSDGVSSLKDTVLRFLKDRFSSAPEVGPRWVKASDHILAIILFPLVFLITLPIELPLWREYKKQGYNVPGYLKFFWYRCLIMDEKKNDFRKINRTQNDESQW